MSFIIAPIDRKGNAITTNEEKVGLAWNTYEEAKLVAEQEIMPRNNCQYDIGIFQLVGKAIKPTLPRLNFTKVLPTGEVIPE